MKERKTGGNWERVSEGKEDRWERVSEGKEDRWELGKSKLRKGRQVGTGKEQVKERKTGGNWERVSEGKEDRLELGKSK